MSSARMSPAQFLAKIEAKQRAPIEAEKEKAKKRKEADVTHIVELLKSKLPEEKAFLDKAIEIGSSGQALILLYAWDTDHDGKGWSEEYQYRKDVFHRAAKLFEEHLEQIGSIFTISWMEDQLRVEASDFQTFMENDPHDVEVPKLGSQDLFPNA